MTNGLGPSDQEPSAPLFRGGEGVLVFRTLPNATVRLRSPDDEQTLVVYSDMGGEVRLDFSGELSRDTLELHVEAEADGRSESLVLRIDRTGSSADALVRSRLEDRWLTSPLRDSLRRLASADLDPLTASDDVLRVLGYPPRPSDDAHPHERAVWEMLASQPYLPVEAETAALDESPSSFTHSTRIRPHRDVSILPDPNFMSSTIWCGYVLRGNPGSFTQVDGFWNVPDVTTQPGLNAETAVWVGLDGWDVSNVLQAGTNSGCASWFGMTLSYHYAWTEWYPERAHRLTNIPVSAGDKMYVRVWHDSDGPHYLVANMDRGLQVFAGQWPFESMPSFSGANAEWIVERPASGGTPYPLAKFNRIAFEGATAISAGRLATVLDGHRYAQVAMFDQYLRAFPWADGYFIPTITNKFVRQ